MENTITLFRVIHRIALSTLLLLIASIPLITQINMVTTLVILPAFLILIFLLSVLIEQKLTTLSLNEPTIKNKGSCLIKKCLLKNCLS